MSSLKDLTEGCREILKAVEKSDGEFEKIVFTNILNATIESMQGKVFQEGFEYLQKIYGDTFAEKFITMMSFGILHASYSAVASYHNEMVEIFKEQNIKIAGLEGALHAMEGAVRVLQKKVDDLNKKEIVRSVSE